MTGSILKSESCRNLTKLFALLSGSVADTLASLVGKPLVVRPVDTRLLDHDALIGGLTGSYVVARGSFDKDYADKSMSVMFEVKDAITMSGMLMMSGQEVIEHHREAGLIAGEDAEAFGELSNVLFSGVGTTLRDHVDNIDIRLQKHGLAKPGVDVDDVVDVGVIVAHTFVMKIGDYPETTGYMVIDLPTAEMWNKGPLASEVAPVEAVHIPEGAPARTGLINRDENDLEGIPAAPIRGTLAAFVSQPEVYRTLRQSCRRVGLDLRRHGKGEIPNPAAHKDEIVLVDVPPGDDRQFDWCKRVKDFSPDNKVVMLLHHPSRNRVTQAFLSKADVILGFPCDELQLSHKLNNVLEGGTSPTPQD